MKDISGLGKAVIARVLGRDTMILRDYVPIETLCEGCRCKIVRTDSVKKRQSKWRSMWRLTLKDGQQMLYCSEACIVKKLNDQEDNNPDLIASNLRSELCDSITAAPLMGLFGELLWLNKDRWGPHDF